MRGFDDETQCEGAVAIYLRKPTTLSYMALDLTDGVLGGIVAWYSIIHTPPARLLVVFAEFHRVLGPGASAHLLLRPLDIGDTPRGPWCEVPTTGRRDSLISPHQGAPPRGDGPGRR